jgi:beta-glucosidase
MTEEKPKYLTEEVVLKFPENFHWGTATAAFQIEGHPEEYLAKLSDWSKWLDREDKVLRPTNDGRAVNHYEHVIEDVGLIRGLNSDAYRFSFNWARIHKGPGEFDENALQFYETLLNELDQTHLPINERKKKVEPYATLIHFVLPSWLADNGGWENPQTAYEFENFTKKILEKFGNRIRFWITHNEPNIFLGFGYESGIWPPGKENDWTGYFKAYQGLLLGHQLAYKAIKEFNSDYQVGFAQNLYYYEAQKDEDMVPNVVRSQLHNYSFIDACKTMGCLDFLGVNYYTRFSYKLNPEANDPTRDDLKSDFWGELQDMAELEEGVKKNNLGWELYAEGLFRVLSEKKMRDLLDGIPVYITENGYCHIEGNESLDLKGGAKQTEGSVDDLEDEYRIQFIKEHLVAVHKLIQSGLDVRGYFYWSLLDNFEWALGMKPRFGLIHVDHQSFKRTPKASYHYYSKLCRKNGLFLEKKIPILEHDNTN